MESFAETYGPYFKDESRTVGFADSISFPESEDDLRADVKTYAEKGTGITVQGARTGLTGGCVPFGGHILNTQALNRVTGMSQGADGTFFVEVQPGLALSALRTMIADKSFATENWSSESLAAYEAFKQAPAQFFPPDPTEASAFLGGIAACNASGAKSYLYGSIRPYVQALRMVLSDGDVLQLTRGVEKASGRHLTVKTEDGRLIECTLPSYQMPDCKNASGYYCKDDMDAVDLIIGSDGTLGVISLLTLRLVPMPSCIWGVSVFFQTINDAIAFTEALRPNVKTAAAIEYFDGNALDLLRSQKENNAAFSSLPVIPTEAKSCIYIELHCDSEESAENTLFQIGDIAASCGGSEDATWVARDEKDKNLLLFFRHAVPESANMLIDLRRVRYPDITKLGSDMSVPDGKLADIVTIYRDTCAEEALDYATWGHIGNNHLHVNILPKNPEEYAKGKALFARWAQIVTEMGGAVSAEHGVGKIKRDFLRIMYGDRHLREMAAVKKAFDPACVLGRGNLFPENMLEA